MENTTRKREILEMVKGLEQVKAHNPNLDVDLQFFILCYNMLLINEIILAEAIFDKISAKFFTHTAVDAALDKFDDVQRMIELENSIDMIFDDAARAKALVEHKRTREEAEVFYVLADFPKEVHKSAYIEDSKQFANYVNSLKDLTFEIDTTLGLPTVN